MVTRLGRILLGLGLSVFAGKVAAAPGEPGKRPPSDTAIAASEDAPETGDESGDAAARAAFVAGVEASRAERWADAEREFRRSAALVRRQSTLYNWALSLYMERRFRECLVVLDELFRAKDAVGDSRYLEYANTLSQRVRSELSVVRLIVDPPIAHVRVDGEEAREAGAERLLEVLPGMHDAEVSAPEYRPQRLSFETSAGVELERTVKLEPARSNPPGVRLRTQTENSRARDAPFMVTTAPWIAVGLGGALLAAGAVTGVLALKADDDLAQKCPASKNCDPSLRSDQDRALSLGRATDILLVSGGAFLAGGVAWRLLVPVPSGSGKVGALFLGASGHF